MPDLSAALLSHHRDEPLDSGIVSAIDVKSLHLYPQMLPHLVLAEEKAAASALLITH